MFGYLCNPVAVDTNGGEQKAAVRGDMHRGLLETGRLIIVGNEQWRT